MTSKFIRTVSVIAFLILSCCACSGITDSDSRSTESASAETQTQAVSQEESGSIAAVTLPNSEQAADVYAALYPSTETAAETTGTAAETTETAGDTYASTGIPAVALTFDDGPNPETTEVILDALEKYQAHATFFIVGENAKDGADTLKREVALGCELGTHTYTHTDLTSLSAKQRKKEINKSIKAIEKYSGGKVTLIRPPYGSINAEIKEELSLPIILWNLDTLDWQTRDTKKTIKKVKKNVEGGDIILMHDIYEESAAAAEKIIAWLTKKNYKLLTVSELYDYYEVDLSLHKGHGSA